MTSENLLLFRGEIFNPNFYYFSGLDLHNSFFLVKGGRKKLLVSRLEEKGARKHMKRGVVVLDDFYPYLKKELKGRNVKIDGTRLPARIYERLRRFCRPEDASTEFFKKRMVKRKDELEKIKKAVKITKKILASLELSKKMTENEVKKQILMKTVEAGAEPAFGPIVAGGSNTAIPHHSCTNKKLGNFILIDYGVKIDNYCADLTRCFSIGRAEKEMKLYEEVKDIFHRIIDKIPEMKTSGNVGKLYEKVVKSKKFPRPVHAIGHGLGIDVHEFPRFGKKYLDDIKGTVFTIEPGIYLQRYGARYEEDVYYDGKKVRIL